VECIHLAHKRGFFHGAALPDPARLLQGTGKFMRHVKLRPGTATNAAALSRLIDYGVLGYKGARRKRLATYLLFCIVPIKPSAAALNARGPALDHRVQAAGNEAFFCACRLSA